MNLFERLLDLLFPPRCVACQRQGRLFCQTCRASLQPYPPEPPPLGLDDATVAFVFARPLQRAIHALKYYKQQRIATPLAALLIEHLRAKDFPADGVLAVPLHPDRLVERGFNQAELLARPIAESLGLPMIPGLIRCRDTGHQARLNRRDRQQNLRGAFAWQAAIPPPPRLLLIDDVLTTGATLVACAEALRLAGAHEIRGVALARSQIATAGNFAPKPPLPRRDVASQRLP